MKIRGVEEETSFRLRVNIVPRVISIAMLPVLWWAAYSLMRISLDSAFPTKFLVLPQFWITALGPLVTALTFWFRSVDFLGDRIISRYWYRPSKEYLYTEISELIIRPSGGLVVRVSNGDTVKIPTYVLNSDPTTGVYGVGVIDFLKERSGQLHKS